MASNLTKQEKELLMDLMVVLKQDAQLAYEDTVMVAIQINTTEKLEALKEWLRTKREGKYFHLTANELLNKTAQISRM